MTKYRAPICIGCKRIADVGLSCAAYPQGIPDDILESRADHRQPYAGDHGLQFDPTGPLDAAYAASIFGKQPAQEGE